MKMNRKIKRSKRMKKYNDSRKFDKELTNMLFDMIAKDLKETIEFSIDTHNLTPLKEIMKILKENRFK